MPLPVSTTILLAAASIALIFGRFGHVRADGLRRLFFFVVLLLASYSLWIEPTQPFSSVDDFEIHTVWSQDALALSEQWLVLAFGLLAGIVHWDAPHGELRTFRHCGFLLFVIAGLTLVARSNDFLSLGLSFEIVNLALAALRGSSKPPLSRGISAVDRLSGRSFELGSVWLSSIWLWFGVAILANATASTHFDTVRRVLTLAYEPGGDHSAIGSPSRLILLAIGLIATSLFARMGLVPFQFGLEASLRYRTYRFSGLSICAEQLAASMILTRLFGRVFVGMGHSLTTLMMTVCLASFALSIALAARSLSPNLRSIPRWLASFVLLQSAWLGIDLMIVATELEHPTLRWATFAPHQETLGLIVLTQLSGLLACGGIYWSLSYLARADREVEFLEDLKGLGQSAPVAAVTLSIAMASAIGWPLTAGFWARWLTLLAGHNVHLKSSSNIFTPHEGLRVVLLLGTLATIFFAAVAFRMIREIWIESPLARPTATGGRGVLAASLLAAVACLTIGVAPQVVLIPWQRIPPPREMIPPATERGSGVTPLGWNGGGKLKSDPTNAESIETSRTQ